MRKVLKTKAMALLLALALVLPLLPVFSLKALAADHTYYIDYGNITVAKNAGDASMLDVSYYATPIASSGKTDTIAVSDNIVITQIDKGRTANFSIEVFNGDANITLDHVYIHNPVQSPFSVSTGATVHLTLFGENRFGDTNQPLLAEFAGIHVPNGATIVIDKKSNDINDSLTILPVIAAGIGGNRYESCGTVIINGGTVNANGGTGAGIGGGYAGNGGTVTINGGFVTAYGGVRSAGIGAGSLDTNYGGGNGGATTITGGTVNAFGADGGAGIGGGANNNPDNHGGKGGTTTITGGTVIASGGYYIFPTPGHSANIGGGAYTEDQGTLIIDVQKANTVLQAGYGGRITDNGGGAYTIEATENDFVIDGLWVDGNLVPAAAGEEAQSVFGAKESIIVTFAYTANFKKPANGSLTVSSAGETITSGEIVRGGQQLKITAVPDAGYVLESLTVNGEDITDKYASGYTYTVGTKGYYRALTAQKDTGTQGARIDASFVLESSLYDTLVSIKAPDTITGVLSGTAKTAAALGLPTEVTLVTNHGSAQANITWDVASCAYVPGNTAAQFFTVLGAVTLPAGVQNPNSVALSTGVSVSVNAAQPVPAAWLTAAVDGAADVLTSTKIDLTFDTAVVELKAEDITLTSGTGSVIKGALSGSGTSWSIALDSVTVQGDVSVAVASPSGFSISCSPKTVAVYKAAEPSGTAPLITTSTLENGRAGLPYSQSLSATGDMPVTWTVETGSLPGGLTLSGATISGTPLAAGTFTFTIKAQNSAGFDLKALSITVGPASYTVSASAELGGSITPGGTVTVVAGSSQTFAISPVAGFTVATVTVDNIDQGPINEYTFATVDKDHTIHAFFTPSGDDMAYGLRETKVSSTVISAEGLFKPSAKLNAIPLGVGSREDLEARLSGKDVISAFEITIDPEDTYRPPLNVSFEIGDMYNGRTVYILHRLHSGDVEQFTPNVMDGKACITVKELSPFLLAADPWITITAQPLDATVLKGQTAIFFVTAAGETQLNYQWQKKTRLSAAWADIPGAAGPEYITSQTALLNSGFQYRVVITDALNNSVVSDAAALTVVKPPDTGDHDRPVLYTVLTVFLLAFSILLFPKRKDAQRRGGK